MRPAQTSSMTKMEPQLETTGPTFGTCIGRNRRRAGSHQEPPPLPGSFPKSPDPPSTQEPGRSGPSPAKNPAVIKPSELRMPWTPMSRMTTAIRMLLRPTDRPMRIQRASISSLTQKPKTMRRLLTNKSLTLSMKMRPKKLLKEIRPLSPLPPSSTGEPRESPKRETTLSLPSQACLLHLRTRNRSRWSPRRLPPIQHPPSDSRSLTLLAPTLPSHLPPSTSSTKSRTLTPLQCLLSHSPTSHLSFPFQSSPPPLPYPSLPPLPCLQSLSCPPHPPSTTITVSSSLYDIPSAWTREGHSLLRTRGMG